jgi:hypothetical protein
LLSSASQKVRLDGCSSWVFANVDSRGYYRTSYGPEGLKALSAAVRNSQLTPVEQTSLLEDVWALVRFNEEHIAGFLSLARDVVTAPLSPALLSATARINFISDRLVSDAQRPAFERWVRQTLAPLAQRLGWSATRQENEDRRSIRSAVLYTLGSAGRDPDVLREARRRVELHLASAASTGRPGTPARQPRRGPSGPRIKKLTRTCCTEPSTSRRSMAMRSCTIGISHIREDRTLEQSRPFFATRSLIFQTGL